MQNPSASSILLVDDDPSIIQALGRILTDMASVRFASNGGDALRLAKAAPPDLILLDADMPEMDGFQVCEALKADPQLAPVPVIFITSHNDPEVEMAGLEKGAVDFIGKPVQPNLLRARVKTQLGLQQNIKTLRSISAVDLLTHCGTESSLLKALDGECQRARRSGLPVSVLSIDVDYLALYNQCYGNSRGDAALVQVAQALQAGMNTPCALLARMEGGRFAALLPDVGEKDAEAIAYDMLSRVEKAGITHAQSPLTRHLTVSIGGCTLQQPAHAQFTGQDLLASAMAALLRAKQFGRAQFVAGEVAAATQAIPVKQEPSWRERILKSVNVPDAVGAPR